MPLPRFNRPELERFLIEIDKALTTPGKVVVIGGAAAILQYGATRSTVDIDTYSAGPAGLEDAIRAAWVTTGLEISVQYAAVADAPFDYEDRLVRLASPHLERLAVMVPERHDLALMKVTRGEERDLVVLDEMHALEPFDLETLVTRYLDELTHAMQDPRILRQKFLLFTERLFGSEVAETTHDRVIRVPVMRELAATTAVVNGRALHKLGIRPETITHERFEGIVRQDSTGAIVFPMGDATGVVALRLETPGGSVVRGEAALGLWTSHTQATDTSLILVSDPLDAMALHQNGSDPHARYAATAAIIDKHQARLLREAIRSFAPDGRILLAFPHDETGDRLAAKVSALEPRRPILRHTPPRLGSWKLFVQDAESAWTRAHGF